MGQELAKRTKDDRMELYLHIPFCVRKCEYCDFLSMPAGETTRRHYVSRLIEEIREKSNACRECQVVSVFLGGGTPSVLSPRQIAGILEAVRECFTLSQDAEVTIECNPGMLDREKLALYKEVGINRLSIGLQSAKNQELVLLGRVHTFEEFVGNYSLARDIGFENINIDLISALPGQTVRDWEETLEKVLELGPEHISAYSLIVEEGTPFYSKYGQDDAVRMRGGHPKYLPEEEQERSMYQRTRELLESHGYRRYEISNYAKKGRECRHNIGYWQGVPYLGLGLGSASLMGHMRFSNTDCLERYLEGEFPSLEAILRKEPDILEKEGVVVLDRVQRMEEFMFLGLRMMEGVSKKLFHGRFAVRLEEAYQKELRKFQQEGLLVDGRDKVCLTEEGIAVSNYVLGGFLLSEP